MYRGALLVMTRRARTARFRFRVAEGGHLVAIEPVESSAPSVERFGQLLALTRRFLPEAVGREGEMAVEVVRVLR